MTTRTVTCTACKRPMEAPVVDLPRLVPVLGHWLCGVRMGPHHPSGWSSGFAGWPEHVAAAYWVGELAAGRTAGEAYANWREAQDRRDAVREGSDG